MCNYSTGVHSGHDLDWDSVFGFPEVSEGDIYIAEKQQEIKDLLQEIEAEFPTVFRELCEAVENAEYYSDYPDNGNETRYFGYELKGTEIEPNGNLQFILNGDYNTIQVIKSPYVIPCYKCSPCYPMQGDVNTPGTDYLSYCLPPEFISEYSDDAKELIARMIKIEEEMDKNESE